MALVRYFQALPFCGQLPDPTGSLLSSLPSSAIEEANAAITSAQQEEAAQVKRRPYLKLSNELKAKIVEYANKNGNVAVARHFSN